MLRRSCGSSFQTVAPHMRKLRQPKRVRKLCDKRYPWSNFERNRWRNGCKLRRVIPWRPEPRMKSVHHGWTAIFLLLFHYTYNYSDSTAEVFGVSGVTLMPYHAVTVCFCAANSKSPWMGQILPNCHSTAYDGGRAAYWRSVAVY